MSLLWVPHWGHTGPPATGLPTVIARAREFSHKIFIPVYILLSPQTPLALLRWRTVLVTTITLSPNYHPHVAVDLLDLSEAKRHINDLIPVVETFPAEHGNVGKVHEWLLKHAKVFKEAKDVLSSNLNQVAALCMMADTVTGMRNDGFGVPLHLARGIHQQVGF